MVQRVRRIQNEREGGFTLIELLIVIVVLGILAGIVVLGLGTFRDDANDAACRADAKQVQIASDAYMARPANTTATPAGAVADFVTLNLLKELPATTAWVYNPADGEVDDSAC
jgi:prepilin-type N-terminal cleavage/methylation domain-containing protein